IYASKGTEIPATTLTKIAKKVTSETGNKTQIKINKNKINSIGGFIIKNKEETVEVDNTFERLLENAKKTLRPAIANILFSR
ncbi:MAG: V-type ATP synthase subunit E family protein, partial [Candidatus Odinarchaeia archaeon]